MSAPRSPLDPRWLCDMVERYLRDGSIPPELRSAGQHRLVELILEVLGRSEAVRRQLAEQADQFSRQAQREKSYFRFALTGILETARDGVVLTANQAAASILGVTPKSLARRPLADVLSLNAPNRSRSSGSKNISPHSTAATAWSRTNASSTCAHSRPRPPRTWPSG